MPPYHSLPTAFELIRVDVLVCLHPNLQILVQIDFYVLLLRSYFLHHTIFLVRRGISPAIDSFRKDNVYLISVLFIYTSLSCSGVQDILCLTGGTCKDGEE